MKRALDQLETGQSYLLPEQMANALVAQGVAEFPRDIKVGPSETKPAVPSEKKVVQPSEVKTPKKRNA